jgi:hypothetical protein
METLSIKVTLIDLIINITPYSLGKLFEWKHALLHKVEGIDWQPPYSLGKLFEWKHINFSHSLEIP